MSSIFFTRAGCGIFFVSALALAPVVRADEQTPPQQPQPPAAAPAKPDLSNWWHKTSYAAGVAGRTLTHEDATVSFSSAQGNTSGTSFDARGNFDVRRGHITSNIFGQFTRRDMNYGPGGGSTQFDEDTVREQLDYDLNRHVKLVGGLEHYRNTLMFMDHRVSGYGGAGGNLYHSERHQLSMTAALGYSHFVFDDAAMLRLNPHGVASLDTTSPSSAGVLLLESWRWVVSPRLTFSQSASRMEYFAWDLGYRWTADFDAAFPITRQFSLSVSYHMKHETNEYIRALRVLPYDRMFAFGIRFSH